MKTLSKAIAIASLVTAGALTSQAANAEVEYSAEAATSYLYRGQDQGASGLISGAIDFSHDSGAYAGLWAAGAGATPEYDLYAGFAMDAGDVSIDIGAVTYVYPGVTEDDGFGNEVEGDVAPFDGMEAYINVGFKGASLSYNMGLESLEDSTYIALGYEMDALSITYGMSDDDAGNEYSHVDLGVALSEEFSLTISQAMDDSSAAVVAAGDSANEDTQVVLTFALPIK
jgi:uncharacterized protein (TIGR02001 family)